MDRVFGSLLLACCVVGTASFTLERSGATTALPSFGSDPVFTGPDARYVVTVEAAGARCAVPADFDGDGDMDIVSVSSNDNTVAWYQRLSDGTYGPKSMISRASNGARIVTVGDIDQDNKTDVIVASYYDHTVGWFRNLGGSFSEMNVITRTAISAQGVSVADIDNDGDLDVLSASSGDNSISWYENLGDGGKFCEVKKIVDTNSQGVRTVIAADLDEDGYIDLAAASKDDNSITWYRNDHTNHFEKIVIDSNAKGAYSLVAVDVDHDGHLDLVTAANMDGFDEHPDNGEGGKVSLYRNARGSDGQLCNFQKVAVTAGNSTGQNDFDWFVLSVWAGDLDNDGDIDIASASFGLLHQGGISWYENVDGQGNQWTRHQIYVTPGVKTGHYVFGADMDGDGDNDLIAVTNGDNKVQILTASTSCDGSNLSPREECCKDEKYWNGVACVACELGTFLQLTPGQGALCAPCSSTCPRAGLAFLPSTCHSMTGCGDVAASFARCDCGQDRYLDEDLGVCTSCPDGHITRHDQERTVADYTMVQRSFLDQTKYYQSDKSWTGFNESRCHIPSCEGGYIFNLTNKSCDICLEGSYSPGGPITECKPCPAGYECPEGTSLPVTCPVGHYSRGGVAQCLQCPRGTFADIPGLAECKNCTVGEYNDAVGQEFCEPCPVGTYVDYTGAQGCLSCEAVLHSSTTMLMRAANASECVCKPETWRGEDASKCTPCPTGVDCSGGDFEQLVKAGYYARAEDFSPFQGVWKCVVAEVCPGGPVETCENGRTGLACANCPDGMYGIPGEDCKPCSGDKRVLVWLMWFAAIAACIGAYYSMNSPLTSKATTLLTTSCAFGLTVTMLQSLGVFSLLSLPWPSEFIEFVKVFNVVMMDVDLLALECAYETHAAPPRYSTNVLFFFIIELIIISCSLLSRFLPPRMSGYRWTWPKTLNTMGQFLQVTFTTMLCMALIPMMCYSHPNGSKSVLKYAHVVCGSGDHQTMLGMGVPLLCAAVAFYVSAMWMAYSAPKMAAAGRADFLQAVRFLLFRFRPDVWWWGLVLMLRAIMMSLAPVVATDNSRIQMLVIMITLATVLSLQVYFWPWKVPVLNLVDAIISVSLMLIIAIVSTFIVQESVDDFQASSQAGFTVLLLTLVGLLYSSCGILVMMAVSALFFRGQMGTVHDSFNLRQAPDPELMSILFHQTSQKISNMQRSKLETVLTQLPIYDLWTIERLITLIEHAGALPGQGRVSWGQRSSEIRNSGSFQETGGPLPTILGSTPKETASKQKRPEEQSQEEPGLHREGTEETPPVQPDRTEAEV